jgi:hypothetical protein
MFGPPIRLAVLAILASCPPSQAQLSLPAEWQYATPYFANAVGVLMSAGRARDLLPNGVRALNHSSAQMALGNWAIPQQHGNFFIAPMADAMALYAPLVCPPAALMW